MANHDDGSLALYDRNRRHGILTALPTDLLSSWLDELTGTPGWALCLAELGGAHPANALDAWAAQSRANADLVDVRCAAALAQRWDRELVEWQAARRTKFASTSCRRHVSARA
jgi:hypothetical protein